MPERMFDFDGLCELPLGINNWPTLNNWIRDRGFPPGHICGRRRIWTEREVFAWVETQPTQNKMPLRGFAKENAEARRARLSGHE